MHSAAAAYPAWAATGPGSRRELLRAADAILAHQAELVKCMIEETGATEGWAAFNVVAGASLLREAASMTTQISGEIIPTDVPDNLAMGIRQPLGVCVAMAPWNAPVILGVIDDALVIDLNGAHQPWTAKRSIKLSAGMRTVHLPYFQGRFRCPCIAGEPLGENTKYLTFETSASPRTWPNNDLKKNSKPPLAVEDLFECIPSKRSGGLTVRVFLASERKAASVPFRNRHHEGNNFPFSE